MSGLVTVVQPPANGSQAPPESVAVRRSRTAEAGGDAGERRPCRRRPRSCTCAVGVVAVRVGDGAARSARPRPAVTVNGLDGGEAGAVEGRHRLRAGEVAEAVGRGVRAGRVVGRAREADLVDARSARRSSSRRRRSCPDSSVLTKISRAARRRRYGLDSESVTTGADGAELSTVTVRVAEVKVLPAWSVVTTRRS